MINNNNSVNTEQLTNEQRLPVDQPNENTGIYVRGFVKITDPESGKVLVETGK